MISNSTISHMQGVVEALAADELHLCTVRLLPTGARVAALVEVEHISHGLTANTPLALLKPGDEPFVDEDGTLTAAANRAFRTLKSRVLNHDFETWFHQEPNGRVHVCFSKQGKPGDPQAALITLPWGDPAELFEDLRIEQATAAGAPDKGPVAGVPVKGPTHHFSHARS